MARGRSQSDNAKLFGPMGESLLQFLAKIELDIPFSPSQKYLSLLLPALLVLDAASCALISSTHIDKVLTILEGTVPLSPNAGDSDGLEVLTPLTTLNFFAEYSNAEAKAYIRDLLLPSTEANPPRSDQSFCTRLLQASALGTGPIKGLVANLFFVLAGKDKEQLVKDIGSAHALGLAPALGINPLDLAGGCDVSTMPASSDAETNKPDGMEE